MKLRILVIGLSCMAFATLSMAGAKRSNQSIAVVTAANYKQINGYMNVARSTGGNARSYMYISHNQNTLGITFAGSDGGTYFACTVYPSDNNNNLWLYHYAYEAYHGARPHTYFRVRNYNSTPGRCDEIVFSNDSRDIDNQNRL